MIKCIHCGECLPVGAFPVASDRPTGWRQPCRECKAADDRRRRAEFRRADRQANIRPTDIPVPHVYRTPRQLIAKPHKIMEAALAFAEQRITRQELMERVGG